MDIKTSRYFKKLIKEIQERKEEGLLSKSSSLTIERLNNKFLTCFRKFNAYKERKYSKFFTTELRRRFYKYLKKEVKKNNRGIKDIYITKLKPKFRKELNDRIIFSLSLIKTQDKTSMLKLSDRFLNWLNNETMNGNDKTLRETLELSEMQNKQSRHYKFILKDQTQKLFSNIDSIIAKDCNAIGFFWRTRRDKRVVGNPAGLYPKPTNEDMHDNHYKREGQFYFYPKSWVLKNNLVDKSKISLAEFDDGLPGEPIGCRCYAENIYDIEDVPNDFLNEKGVEYIKSQ